MEPRCKGDSWQPRKIRWQNTFGICVAADRQVHRQWLPLIIMLSRSTKCSNQQQKNRHPKLAECDGMQQPPPSIFYPCSLHSLMVWQSSKITILVVGAFRIIIFPYSYKPSQFKHGGVSLTLNGTYMCYFQVYDTWLHQQPKFQCLKVFIMSCPDADTYFRKKSRTIGILKILL